MLNKTLGHLCRNLQWQFPHCKLFIEKKKERKRQQQWWAQLLLVGQTFWEKLTIFLSLIFASLCKNKKQQHSVMLTCLWPFFVSSERFSPHSKLFVKIEWKSIKLFSCVKKIIQLNLNLDFCCFFCWIAAGNTIDNFLINYVSWYPPAVPPTLNQNSNFHDLIQLIPNLCAAPVKCSWLFRKLIKTSFSVRLAWSLVML